VMLLLLPSDMRVSDHDVSETFPFELVVVSNDDDGYS